MYAQFYAGMRWSALPLFALLLFMALFVSVIARTYFGRRQRAELEAASRLPLDSAGEIVVEQGGRP